MADRIAAPMSAEVIADRLHLVSYVVRRVLRIYRPENLGIYDRMVAIGETLKQLSDRFPDGELRVHPRMLQTTERYLHLIGNQLTQCAQCGYHHKHLLCEELLRAVDDLHAIQSCLLHALVVSAPPVRVAA